MSELEPLPSAAPADIPPFDYDPRTRLVFGARPVEWAAARPDQQIPPDLAETLAALFPTGVAFYPFSNRC